MLSRGDTAKGHSSRGTGNASRIPLSNNELVNQGWEIQKSGNGLKWKNPDGKSFYSSSAVKEYLDAVSNAAVETSESDYEPMEASSDDCYSSPEKAPLPYETYRSQKRIKLVNRSSNPIELPQKYHMTSQLQDFIDQINMSRSCSVVEECQSKARLYFPYYKLFLHRVQTLKACNSGISIIYHYLVLFMLHAFSVCTLPH